MLVAPTTMSKREALDARIRALGRTLVAYSGGVDSAFLAWATYQALGADMLAVIADSPSLARTHLAEAVAFAREQSIPLEIISYRRTRPTRIHPQRRLPLLSLQG